MSKNKNSLRTNMKWDNETLKMEFERIRKIKNLTTAEFLKSFDISIIISEAKGKPVYGIYKLFKNIESALELLYHEEIKEMNNRGKTQLNIKLIPLSSLLNKNSLNEDDIREIITQLAVRENAFSPIEVINHNVIKKYGLIKALKTRGFGMLEIRKIYNLI